MVAMWLVDGDTNDDGSANGGRDDLLVIET